MIESDWAELKDFHTALEWKQNFFQNSNFLTADELVSASLVPGDAQLYVRQLLALRSNKHKRHTWASYVQQCVVRNQSDKWWGPFTRTAFEIYKLEPRLILDIRSPGCPGH